MSHHLDSPLARQDPRLNITDQYVFDDRDGTVFVLNTRTSLAGDTTPHGFHEEGRYEVRIQLDQADVEDLTFRFAFDEEDEDAQRYRLWRLEGDAAGDDTAIGAEIVYGRTGQVIDSPDGIRVWTGRALDPFFLDLDQLAAVDRLFLHGEDAELTGYLPGKAANTFADATVQSIVLRVPHSDRALFAERDIRVWSTTRLATDAGGWRPIGRAGLPMIWPIFRDANSDAASTANETHPSRDAANYGSAIRELVAAAVRRLGTSSRPEAYAARVADRIVPDSLPYRVGTAATFGFAAFNGRHLVDNAPEVMFSLATNSAVSTGLPPELSAGTRSSSFPFVVPV
ncbi:DUF4331 family protein [Cryptosporangium arvum]|uniref:DUF4331 domain-containing protein n=1 Tax=Cryptosporangium arvum DSM 44712 TaxID=927661 RepID=A0A010ZTT0_9ACTN|nr:DUF4331 family protein [Cryptosporangium arvum]EXG82109.1 hypothetical protein CryarDRAFT_3250 [Cryptosporangium arvum DSM 44712]